MLSTNSIEADKPFDSSADADIILRSSNKVDFFVQKSFLRFVCSFFDNISSELLPYEKKIKDRTDKTSPPSLKRSSSLFPSSFLDKILPINRRTKRNNDENDNDGLLIVELEEDSTTLYNLLLLVYPCSKEPPCTIDVFLKVGKAAKKYGMEGVEEKLVKAARSMDALTKEPFRVFAVAYHFGWVEVMKEAARNILKLPIRTVGQCEELKLLSSVEYDDLLQWLFDCRDAVEKLFAEWDSQMNPSSSTSYWNFFSPPREKRAMKGSFRIAADTGVMSRVLAEHARKAYPGVVVSRGSAEAEIEEALSMIPLKINEIWVIPPPRKSQ